MEPTPYITRLRYLDAKDVDDAVIDYNGLDVRGPDGEKIGDIDGFIIDAEARRLNYIVVDSGGWFSSRRLLMPIGHASLADDRKSLRADITRDALRRLPEFDEHRFKTLTDDELKTFERDTVVACCPDEPLEQVAAGTWSYDSRRHYRQPGWWSSSVYAPERLRPIDADAFARPEAPPAAAAPAAAAPVVRDEHNRELVTAYEAPAKPRRRSSSSRRATGDVSPHLDGRAHPGDVLGIETGGERTGLGDTPADEAARRRAEERGRGDQEI